MIWAKPGEAVVIEVEVNSWMVRLVCSRVSTALVGELRPARDLAEFTFVNPDRTACEARACPPQDPERRETLNPLQRLADVLFHVLPVAITWNTSASRRKPSSRYGLARSGSPRRS